MLIFQCTNPLCGQEIMNRFNDRCSAKAIVIITNKKTGEEKVFCGHCYQPAMDSGLFTKEQIK